MQKKKEKIYYVANITLPNSRANSIQAMNMCNGLSQVGKNVVFIVPKMRRSANVDIFGFYGMKPTFQIVRLPILDLSFLGNNKFTFLVRLFSFTLSSLIYFFFHRGRFVIYTRGEAVLFLALLPNRYKIFWETQIRPGKMYLYERAMKRCGGVVTVTKYYRNELTEKYKVDPKKIICEPDAVSIKKFGNISDKATARKKLSLPQDRIILVYVGTDLSWKGLVVFKQAVRDLPEKYLAVIDGNIKKDFSDDSRFYYAGQCSHDDIPTWLAAADMLVLTGKADSVVSMHYTSPMKMFEYMASGKPIVAFDIPSFRDVLSEKNAFFVSADDPQLIAEQIMSFDEEDGLKRAKQALCDVKNYTWVKRVKRILSFVEDTLNAKKDKC